MGGGLNIFKHGGRYEIRSSSGTAWWRTKSLDAAFRVLRESGAPGDYVYDSVTGGRPRDPGAGKETA